MLTIVEYNWLSISSTIGMRYAEHPVGLTVEWHPINHKIITIIIMSINAD